VRLLLIEDDAQLGRATQTGLAQQGHAVDWVRDGITAQAAVEDGDYGAVLLDLGLPRQDGLEVLRAIRRGGFSNPVLIITARDDIQERILGLDTGADDFIVKPCDLQELGARLRAAARRCAGRTQTLLVHDDLQVDPAARSAVRNGAVVALTTREFALLTHLLERRGHVRSRQQLQESLYDWDSEIESNAIEVHIHNLRRKLGRDLIRTVHGHGYTIDPPRTERLRDP
jgi:two-component system, OmpR family, response regulator QseB